MPKSKKTEITVGAMIDRAHTAAAILGGMLASAPLCDRTKINKRQWVKIALVWADLLYDEARYIKP